VIASRAGVTEAVGHRQADATGRAISSAVPPVIMQIPIPSAERLSHPALIRTSCWRGDNCPAEEDTSGLQRLGQKMTRS